MTQSSEVGAAVEIALPGRLDLGSSKQVRTEIEAARGSPLMLKAGAVEFVGAAGAEILLAAHAEWAASGLDFQVTEQSESLTKGLSQLGLAQTFLTEKGNA